MSKTNKMLEALSKVPRLRIVDDPQTVILGGESARLDGWANDLTGQGTGRDKTTYNYFSPGRILQDGEASALYHDNDVAARMVDIVPDEMLREGFAVDVGDAKANTEIADQVEGLGLDDKLADGIRWGRCYGGGGLLLGADDGRSAAAPLQPEKAKALSYVYVLDRRYLWPLTYYTEPGHPKLGQAETYMVTSPSFAAQAPVAVVHETRLVLFGGAKTGLREREANNGWDHSILQRATKVLSDFDMGWGAVAVLLADGNQGVYKLVGLADAILQGATSGDSGGGEKYLRERLRLMDMSRSIVRGIALDAGGGGKDAEPGEDFTRQVFPMTGIPDVLEKLMVRLAVTVDVPCTRLFGISPAGMNATGESDVRGWYDRTRSKQNRELAPKIRRIIRVALQTKALKLDQPGAIKITFPSLWSEAPQAAATTRKITLEGDKVASDAGFILPETVGLQRFGTPDGFAKELALGEDEKSALEVAVKEEAKRIEEGTPEPGFDENGNPVDPNAPPAPPAAAPPSPQKQAAPGAKPEDEEADERSDGSDDQPRDELGQFAETDGGGAAGGGASGKAERGSARSERVARARERHAEASQRHADANAAHEKAEREFSSERAEALNQLDTLARQREAAAAEARALAAEVDARIAADKAAEKAFKAETKSAEKEYDRLTSEKEESEAEYESELEKIGEDFDAQVEALPEGDDREARRQGLIERQVEVERAVEERYAKTWEELDEKISAAEERAGAEYEGEDRPSLKETAKELRSEAKANAKPDKAAAAIRDAIDHGDFAKVERITDNASVREPEDDQIVQYLADKADPQGGERWLEARDRIRAERPGSTGLNPDGLLDTARELKTTERKLVRAARAVKAHEREISRLEKGGGGQAQPPKARSDGRDDQPRDERGRWAASGGGSGGGAKTAAEHVRSNARASTPREFKTAFTEAMRGSEFKAFVNDYSEDELGQMKALVLVGGDGAAGIAVKDHGDGRIEGTALFSQGGPKGTGSELLQRAVTEHGVNYLECFGERLRSLYERSGFVVESASDFSDEYAPKDWNPEHGRPKYYTLRRAK